MKSFQKFAGISLLTGTLFFNSVSFAALPQALGGSGFGLKGRKANIEGNYPTFWDNLMKQQSYSDMRRGLLEMASSKYDDAAQSFAKAVVKNPQEPYPHVFLGVALYWQGKVDQAMGEYRAALNIDPDNAEARQLLGIAHAWRGEVKTALDEFKRAAELAPKRSDVHMNLGSTYAALGNLDDALFHFRRAVEIDGKHPLYQYQLASLLEVLGRDSQAEDTFKRALRLYSNYEEAMLSLAALYEKMGKNTNAEIYYKRALKIKPGDSVARLRLANLLAKQNRKEEAMQILNRAFLISPLTSEGLALSLAYTGGNSSSSSSGGQNNDDYFKPNQQLEQFKKKLLKVPADKQINIEAEIFFEPKVEVPKIMEARPAEIKELSPDGSTPPKTSRFAAVVEKQKAEQNTFSRSFILAPTSPETRARQLEQIFESMNSLLREAGKTYDIKMSLRGGMPAKDTSTLSANTTNPNFSNTTARAGYNPYMVGNDMGLWVTGKGWIKYIQDAMPEIESRLNKDQDPRDYIIYGLAHMMLGEGSEALESYAKAAESQDKNTKQLSHLGIGTAMVILGDEKNAIKEYQKVLEINKDNEIAEKNIEVLETEEK